MWRIAAMEQVEMSVWQSIRERAFSDSRSEQISQPPNGLWLAYTPQLTQLTAEQAAKLAKSEIWFSRETAVRRTYRFTDAGHANGFVVGLRNEGVRVLRVQYR